MTNQIFVLSASSLEGGNGNIEPEKRVVWSRFHHQYQHQHSINHHLTDLNSPESQDEENSEQADQGSQGSESGTEDQEITSESENNEDKEDQEITSESEDNEDKEDHEDFLEEDEDIFTKSLAPEHLDLKNFLIVEDRKKKISQISEIIAYNIGQQKQVCNNSMMELQKENVKTFFDKQERNYWKKLFCCCWYI